MFLETLLSLRHTLALRLTAWYAGIFCVSSILAFTLVYALMVSVAQERTDEDLEVDIEEFVALMQSGGIDRVKTEMAAETLGAEAEDSFLRLWGSDGRERMTTDLSSWPGLDDPQEALAKLDGVGESLLQTLELPGREHNVRSIYATIAPGIVLQIGESLEKDEDFLEALLDGFIIALAVVIVLGVPIGWFMARRALRGVEDITKTATEIADGALERRVVVRDRGDELDRLARTFNSMLDRIHALIIGMREMTDNLAHDLRSPLGRIRAAAEMSLAGDDSSTARISLAASTTEECDRLLEMINTTLDIAEAESGATKLKITDIDLADLVRDACEVFQTVSEDKRVTISTDLPGECYIQGDLQRLQRVVANLLDNALKYMPVGGHVSIVLSDERETVKLSIQDTGVGIPADELAHIFQRFYRCDRSRSEHGNGLGLSLALAFVRAHGGDIGVRSTPGQGSIFTVVLSRSHQTR